MSTYQPAKRHPLTLPLIIAGHGAILAALALSKVEVPGVDPIKRLIVNHIDAPQPPPPPPRPPQPRTENKPSQVESVIDPTPTIVPLPRDFTSPPAPPVPPPPVPYDDVPVGNSNNPPLPPLPAPAPPRPIPAPDPVRVEATRDPRYADDFQPPYPDAMQVRGEEGSAVVRVLIGANGRVTQVEAVSATNPAFMSATTRHARARWRFRPATADGKPVESWKRVTVTFTLND